MASITIKEIDNTSIGSQPLLTNAVYVPGFSLKAVGASDPKMYTSVREFEEDLGGGVTEIYEGATRIKFNAYSYIYAYELLRMGLPVLYEVIAEPANKEFEDFQKAIADHLSSADLKIKDKGEYVFKYITSGGYPIPDASISAVLKAQAGLAYGRGDVTFILDSDRDANLIDGFSSSISDASSGYSDEEKKSLTNATAFYFDADYITEWGDVRLPASFAYLSCLATSTRNNPDWYAIAGVSRGLVPNIARVYKVATNLEANDVQSATGISINCVTNIKPYGYTIWGNRTLHYNNDVLVARSFLNIRQLVNDLNRVVFTACRVLTFEQNADVLWFNFKSKITPLLDQMRSGNGIRGYKITKLPSTQKAQIKARITISPIEAVEDWDIEIELNDSISTVEG